MAFTLSVVPHNFGDLKANKLVATFDGVSSNNHELAFSVAKMGLSSLDALLSEVALVTAGPNNVIYLVWSAGAGKIKVYSQNSAAQIGTSDTPTAGATITALAIGK